MAAAAAAVDLGDAITGNSSPSSPRSFSHLSLALYFFSSAHSVMYNLATLAAPLPPQTALVARAAATKLEPILRAIEEPTLALTTRINKIKDQIKKAKIRCRRKWRPMPILFQLAKATAGSKKELREFKCKTVCFDSTRLKTNMPIDLVY
jgi:hypothetical protein